MLLAIETSGGQGGLALWADGQLRAEHRMRWQRNTAQDLLPALEDFLHAENIKPQALTAMAVSLGPGSFTGLRIGLASAQGLATGLGLPLYGFSSLAILAQQAEHADRPILAVRATRANEVFACVYAGRDQLDDPLMPEGRYTLDDLLEQAKPWQSDLQLLCETVSDEATLAQLHSLVDVRYASLRPRDLARLGALAQTQGRPTTGIALKPLYYAPGV